VVDSRNAHVRGGEERRRRAPDVEADEARRILDDPAFIRGHDRLRNELIRRIEEFKSGGTGEDEEYQLELCRSLRTLKSLRQMIGATIQGQTLREAGFRPRNPDTQDEDD